MYDEYSEVVEEQGDYRARIIVDQDAQEPYNDGATPIFRVDNSRDYWGSYRAEAFNRQAEPYVDAFNRLESYGDKQLEIFERWLRIFHGTVKLEDWNLGNTREYGYIAFDTAAWREEVGAPLDRLQTEDYLSEVRSWAEGDVWGIVVERKAYWEKSYKDAPDEDTEEGFDWIEVEDTAVWGYYGREWAEEAAREELANVIE